MRIVMLGASGAVGHAVLTELQAMPQVQSITTLVRKPLAFATSHNVKVQQVDVLQPDSYTRFMVGHEYAICTFGVGQPTKVSAEEFKRVDHDAVLDFAKACKAAGVKHFTLLGAVAANPASRSAYLKSKGALRDAIVSLGFERFSLFQPSMLITQQNRYGFAQALLLAIFPVINPLLMGPLQNYRGIRVEELGRAMALNTLTQGQGLEVLHHPDFVRLAA
jgi:uncharacterized protein YbjT (DUF2867 family)